MPLSYQFSCHVCGAREWLGPLKISLPDEDMFVHDVGWEYLPKGWIFRGQEIFCDECKRNREGNE